MSRWLAAGLLLPTVLIVVIFFFSPQIIVRVAFELAGAQDIELTELALQRPQLNTIHIDKVAGKFGDIQVIATDIEVRYHFKGLLDQSVDAVLVSDLHIQVNEPQATPSPVQAAAGDTFEPAVFFGIVPQLKVERLLLEIVQADFAGTGNLQLDGDNARFELAGMQPEIAENLSVSGVIQANSKLQFSFFDRSDPEQPFLELNAIPAGQDSDVTGHFDLTGYPLSLVTGLIGLPRGSGRVKGELAAKLDSLDLAQYDALQLIGSFQLDWKDETVEVEALAGQLSGSLTNMLFTMSNGNIAFPDSSVLFTVDSGTAVQYADNQITVGPGMTAILRDIDNTKVQSTLTRTTVDLGEPDISVKADAQFSMTSYGLQTKGSINADMRLPANAVIADINISVGQLSFPLRLNYDRVSGHADFSGTGRWSSSSLGQTLVQNWPYDFDIVSGDVNVDLQGTWRDGILDGHVDVTLARGTVRYDTFDFEKTGAKLDFVINDSALRLQPSTISVGKFEFGLAMHNAEIKVAWQDDVVDIYSGRFELLGGKVTIDPTQYDLTQNMAILNMTVVDIDLAQVLALEGEDITGEGRLYGTLPVRINDDKVSMKNGQIRASEAGGMIQVSPRFTLGTGQPGIDFAMQALTNFNFKTLTAVADYEENGDLALAVSLQGNNPEIEKGRPIHYNLNISENVISLINALNAGSGVTERIERSVMQKQ